MPCHDSSIITQPPLIEHASKEGTTSPGSPGLKAGTSNLAKPSGSAPIRPEVTSPGPSQPLLQLPGRLLNTDLSADGSPVLPPPPRSSIRYNINNAPGKLSHPPSFAIRGAGYVCSCTCSYPRSVSVRPVAAQYSTHLHNRAQQTDPRSRRVLHLATRQAAPGRQPLPGRRAHLQKLRWLAVRRQPVMPSVPPSKR